MSFYNKSSYNKSSWTILRKKCLYVWQVSQKRKTSNNWQQNDINTNEPLVKKAKGTKIRDKKKVANKFTSRNDLPSNSNNQTDLFNESIYDENNVHDSDMHQWSALGVPTPIIKALKVQEFHDPTPIQALTLPPAILGHRDILGAAETGSGKTLAFGIPILNGILELKSKQLNETNGETTEGDINIENKGWICSENELIENDNSLSESDEEGEIESINEDGIGCVRVINNIKMNDVHSYAKKPLYALILTPTRELAIQIKNHLTKAAMYTDIKVNI